VADLNEGRAERMRQFEIFVAEFMSARIVSVRFCVRRCSITESEMSG
jgi:hypothetical protein